MKNVIASWDSENLVNLSQYRPNRFTVFEEKYDLEAYIGNHDFLLIALMTMFFLQSNIPKSKLSIKDNPV